MPRRTPSLLAAVLLLTGLAACEKVQETTGPDPEDPARELVTGLEQGDLARVRLVDVEGAEATASYRAVVERLGEVRPEVTLQEVEERDGGTATATLAWSWPLAGQRWAYESTAELALVEGEWRVRWAPAVVEPSLTDGELLDVTTIEPPRGDILGARGLRIVTPRPVLRLGIDRAQVAKPVAVASARRLAGLVGVDVGPYVAEVRAAGDKAFVEAITFRREEVPARVAASYQSIPGVLGIPDERPLAPTREFAAPLLGTVGQVTAEMVEEHPERYRPGDEAGISGLQARYDEQLRGTPGLVVSAVSDDPSGGDDERELWRVEPQPGQPLRLSLDVDLQAEAEALLADVRPASALVALRPSTGELLAAANGPGTGGYNVATFGQYAPGSTFKIVSSLALLRAGLRPEGAVGCPATTVVDGKRFKNYSDYPASAVGRIPLRTAVAHSCNTAFVSQAARLGDTDLFDAAVSLGLGLDHDLGFPAYFGSVEPAASQTEAAANMIGQGKVLASPMVMAAVIGSVQRGELVVPRMVEGVEVGPPDGAQPLDRAHAAALRAMLRSVVTSGSGRALADVPGPPVIAKTGTAEFGPSDRLQTHAWMVAAQGDLAVAVFVEVGESGSRTAGPILEAFLRAARR